MCRQSFWLPDQFKFLPLFLKLSSESLKLFQESSWFQWNRFRMLQKWRTSQSDWIQSKNNFSGLQIVVRIERVLTLDEKERMSSLLEYSNCRRFECTPKQSKGSESNNNRQTLLSEIENFEKIISARCPSIDFLISLGKSNWIASNVGEFGRRSFAIRFASFIRWQYTASLLPVTLRADLNRRHRVDYG